MTTFQKGLIVTVITILANSLASGWPGSALQYEILGLTMAGSLLVYFGQSFILPATSGIKDLNWIDLLKGGLVATGSALSSFAAAAITATVVDWGSVVKLVISTFIMYLAKNFMSPGAPAK